MVLRAFWASLGVILDALGKGGGARLGALLGLQIGPKGLTPFVPLSIWALFGLSLVSCSCSGVLLLGLASSKSFLILSWSFCRPILISKDEPSEPPKH